MTLTSAAAPDSRPQLQRGSLRERSYDVLAVAEGGVRGAKGELALSEANGSPRPYARPAWQCRMRAMDSTCFWPWGGGRIEYWRSGTWVPEPKSFRGGCPSPLEVARPAQAGRHPGRRRQPRDAFTVSLCSSERGRRPSPPQTKPPGTAVPDPVPPGGPSENAPTTSWPLGRGKNRGGRVPPPSKSIRSTAMLIRAPFSASAGMIIPAPPTALIPSPHKPSRPAW